MDMLDFKYKILKKFLTAEEQKLLLTYTEIAHRNNFTKFDFIQNNNGDTSLYGDPIMESLMLVKKEKLETSINFKLLPTYSFWRMYTYNADLKKHKDRPSCEISATVMIGSCGTEWPIFMDGNKVNLEPGDAVVYKGLEVEHWRENFEGDWHAQVFLHYVNAEGPHKQFYKDQRQFWGEVK